MPGAWRSIEASSSARAVRAVPALERLRGALAVGGAQLERSGAPAGARAPRGDDAQRDCLAAVPRDAGRASPSAPGCWRARARSSQGASVVSAPSIAFAPALAGTTSSGPTPGTSTSRRRRARDERRSRTFTAPLRRSTVRSPSTAGRLCGVRAEQITEPLALHGEGPCWLERSGELAWVDMLAGRILATSLATGATRVIDVPGRSRRWCDRARPAGSSSPRETGVVLLDEHDAPSHLCEILDEPGMRMNEGGCDPQGRFWCGSMAYDVRPGAALAVSRRGRRQLRRRARPA